MKKIIPVLFLLNICFLNSCIFKDDVEKTLLERLREIPGITVAEIAVPNTGNAPYLQSFQIDLIQPVDHNNPAGATFQQRFYLSHRDSTKPFVFYTTGYGVSRNKETELAYLLDGNQILMVHRYFTNAKPVPTEWKYCNIWQAATDQHRIHEFLKDLYPGKWVSGGGSKGGMASLFYKRFYPDDVDATVAYVAPVMTVPDDPRFEDYLYNQVGTAECRNKVKEFQRLVLQRREQLIPLLEQHAQSNSYIFNTFSIGEAFEYSVLEYIFQFWQYGNESNCSVIPTDNSSDQEILDHLLTHSPASYYSDQGVEGYLPLFFQAYTEFGYCPYVYSHLEDLLVSLEDPTYRSFAPQGISMVFNPAVMEDMVSWLTYQGENIIYIYGLIDPWTAAALTPDFSLDSLRIDQPGGNHSIRISQLDQRDQVIAALNRWLGTNLTSVSIKAKNLRLVEKHSRL